MNAPAPMTTNALGEDEFRRIAALLRRRSGISLPETKRSLVYSRLTRRLRALGLADFPSYIDHVEGPDGADEALEMISALTTNVTSFFRERHHFDMLRDTTLPPLIADARNGGRLRLWSAGCSTGEEPYCLAMTVLSLCPDAARLNIRILATDIDPAVLDRARHGRYPAQATEAMPRDLRGRYFVSDAGQWRVQPELAEIITFREMNLVEPWPVKGPFQVIFCRNVAIYFDRSGQERIWSGFVDRLAPGGLLCIGHSERLTGPALSEVQTTGITAYCRL